MVVILYPIQVGWRDDVSTFDIEIECPEALNGCASESIVKRGHDTGVKGHPQHLECQDCEKHFYPHTSGFFFQIRKFNK